jgi:D-psicose/D-tagatose/L-ribulose 3-epimerase
MRFGINTFLFTSPFTTKSVGLFKNFKKWGFDSAELAIEDPSHIDPVRVKEALDENGLVCGSVSGAFGLDRDLRGTPESQQNSMNYVTGVMDHMTVLGCTTFAGPVYSAVGRAEAESDKDKKSQWKLVVKNLKKLCKTAEDKGITIAIEPLNRFETDFINTCDQALAMLADVNSPALAVHLDTFHMNIEEKDVLALLPAVSDLIAHVHLSETNRDILGRGHWNTPTFLDNLKKLNYKGYCSIGVYNTKLSRRECIQQCIKQCHGV